MTDLLLLCHRLPYPPDKGERIRSYNLLRGLQEKFSVYLGCFRASTNDEAHVAALRARCADIYCAPLQAPLRAIAQAFSTNTPLTAGYYNNSGLHEWVRHLIQDREPAHIVAMSSVMANLVPREREPDSSLIMDFVDVDSEKWRLRAERSGWPMSWIYRREARTLLQLDRDTAARFDACLFVSEPEAARFRTLAPEASDKIWSLANGIDCEYFSPERRYENPYGTGPVAVFTGTMDYWPNEEAVIWFAREVMPLLRQRQNSLQFAIVGRSPGPKVKQLAGNDILVTGAVDDVRPYIAHADVVVAPMQSSPGVANKVLEGMAMDKPVVATSAGAGGLELQSGTDYLLAQSAEEFAGQIDRVLRPDTGTESFVVSGRQRVLTDFNWDASVQQLVSLLEDIGRQPRQFHDG